MGKKSKKKKPSSKIDTAYKVVLILSGIATTVKTILESIKVVLDLLKG